MKRILLIFGARGALGSEATNVFLDKKYDKYYFFDFKLTSVNYKDPRVKTVDIEDLSIEEDVAEAFDEVEVEEDAYYFLFSTIGGIKAGNPVWDTSYDDWKFMMDLNLNISFLLAKYFAKLVQKARGGSICFTSAMVGLEPSPNKAAYGTSKSALIYLVKTLAKEGREINLTANAVAPLLLDTAENREWVKDVTSMIKPARVAESIDSVFNRFDSYSGNIFELPFQLSNE